MRSSQEPRIVHSISGRLASRQPFAGADCGGFDGWSVMRAHSHIRKTCRAAMGENPKTRRGLAANCLLVAEDLTRAFTRV